MTPRRAVRVALGPAVALSALAALAVACAPAQNAGRPMSHASNWERPRSYDPPGPAHDPWGPWIRDASRRFDVPERWIREVMRQESGGRAGATSPVGAMGLMQVMPGTYRELQMRHGLGDDPYHPYDSIMAGTAYIREMYELYGSPAFLAAYNAGPRRLEDYLWNSRGLPAETRNYVRRIGPRIAGHHPGRRAAPEVYAAAEIPTEIPPGPRRMDQATMLALREQRQAVDPGIRVAQLPAGPVVRMDPIPDGSTVPAPAPFQVASLGGVVRMDPIPDGSTYGGPVPSSAGPAVVRMDPIPDGSTYGDGAGRVSSGGSVVRMDPIPDGSTPEGAARLAQEPSPMPGGASSLAAAPLPPPVTSRGGAMAAAPSSGDARRAAPAGSVLVASAGAARLAAPAARSGSGVPAAAAQPPTAARGVGSGLVASAMAAPVPRGGPSPAVGQQAGGGGRPGGGFGLMSSAQAAPLAAAAAPGGLAAGAIRPALASPGPATWGVQVGAFSTEALARSAAGAAAGGSGGRAVVQPVPQAGGRGTTLYRARVTGLSQASAQGLCDRLRRNGACAVLPPD